MLQIMFAMKLEILNLAIFSAALVGACVGFCGGMLHLHKFFMGDTGSLALGGALAGISLCLRQK